MSFSIPILLFPSYPEKLGESIRFVGEDPGMRASVNEKWGGVI